MGSSSKNSEDIVELRARIDAIDDEIAGLLLKRIELSNSIMKSKPPTQIVDSAREQEILTRYSAKLSGLSTLSKLKRLVLGILAASRIYPES
jgi:chorismate mutase